jgi:protein-L-isoaspartate(D-aspartate) O-methyltransferase
MSPADQANQALVDQMIAQGALWSRPLIAAFRATPRHLFLNRVYHYQRGPEGEGTWRELDTHSPTRGELRLIYSDRALTTRMSEPTPERAAVPISSSSQPSLMAQMLEDLHLRAGQRVLEIGAGTGYNAALLAHVVGRALSLEVDRRVLAEAAEHLEVLPDRKVVLRHGDGREGWPEEAPFDRILVTASTPDLEPAWLEQLAPGGTLLAPWEAAPGLAYLVRGKVQAEGPVFEGRLVRAAYFMPLRAEAETGRDGDESGSTFAPVEQCRHEAPPWGSWTERRPAATGPGLLASLAFLAWLQGRAVTVQPLADGQSLYGVADPVARHICWLGLREWHVSDDMARQLGVRLWREFLDAGGPWPTDYRLRAWPRDVPADITARTDAVRTFHKQGPRCEQLWELFDRRPRP